MCLNVSLFLTFSPCFYFVNSVDIYKEYESLFYREKETGKISIYSQNLKEYYHEICHSPKGTQHEILARRASICKHTIRNLRKNEPEYRDAYVDFSNFQVNESNSQNYTKCLFVKILHNYWKSEIHQPVLFCFFRPSMILMDAQYHFTHKYNYVAAFPKGEKKMMVFIPDKDEKYYKIFKIISDKDWYTLRNVPHDIIWTPISIPRSYSNIQKIYNLLYDVTEYMKIMSVTPDHILNSSPTNLCLIAYRSAKYDKFDLSPSVILLPPKEEEVILLSEDAKVNIKFFIPMYVCDGDIQSQPRTWVPTDEYRIATGPSNDSVILIHKRNNRFEIIEFILDITLSYVKNFRSY